MVDIVRQRDHFIVVEILICDQEFKTDFTSHFLQLDVKKLKKVIESLKYYAFKFIVVIN